jgi:hypothetical protein
MNRNQPSWWTRSLRSILLTRKIWLTIAICLALLPAQSAAPLQEPSPSKDTNPQHWDTTKLGARVTRDPIFVYNNWSSYDELSDNVPLTEELAMRELDELLRLRKNGMRFDYYMMDAFWYAQEGAYRTWRKPNWPGGPDRWIRKCLENGIRPGMWFSSNTLVKIDAAPQWRDSLNKQGTAMSFYEGGFLPDFMQALQSWYDRGIRMFKFDFVDLTAATPKAEMSQTKEEIQRRNADALRAALKKFRDKNPGVVLEAFNGFGGDMDMTSYPLPFHQPVDLQWLEVFDAQYAGDPRPSDVPEMNFWRSMDIYSDHMVRQYEASGLPLERIDSTGFMVGKTGTIYYRAMNAWKGAMILMMARGGWIDTVHGNLELITDQDARWSAKVQSIFLHLKSLGRTKSFGGIPGQVQPYGFGSIDADGALYTVVNPTQSFEQIELPLLSQEQKPNLSGRLLFRDAGYVPHLTANRVELGPGEMVVIGFGRYASPQYDLGVQDDVLIPQSIHPLHAEFHSAGKGIIEATVNVPAGVNLRLVMQQFSPGGSVRRTWAGGPPNGTNMGKVFTLQAEQNGRSLPVVIHYDKVIWSGLSWAVGEIGQKEIAPNQPMRIRFSSQEKDPVVLEGKLYIVKY